MGFLGDIRGRRESQPVYRTVDGGHPAPYPDMTDEQLYNYETTFNVAKRTFTHPPRPAHASQPAQAQQQPWVEPQAQSRPEPDQAQIQQRMRRNRAFDAPRYTARKFARAPSSSPAGNVVLDFNKPVRTITTKQPVDIITTRARHPIYKVHAYIGDNDVVSVFTLDGRLSENGPHFLENAPERRQLHLNIYAVEGGAERYRITQHESREEADAAAEQGRVACVEVKFEA